jgi:plastocyanin domain-containing protein
MLFEKIFASFQNNKLRYAVIGGIAVNLHGYNRLTGDLDILISLTDENISKLIATAKELGFVPRLPVNIEDFALAGQRDIWINEKNMKVFTIYNPSKPLEHVDIKIDKPENIEAYIDNCITVQAGDISIPVVSRDDLIKLKMEAGRERDLVDIRALERIKALDE